MGANWLKPIDDEDKDRRVPYSNDCSSLRSGIREEGLKQAATCTFCKICMIQGGLKLELAS